MKYCVGFLLIALVVLHQDYWQWDDASVVFEFLPRTLAYHVALSIAAAGVWWLAVVFCWQQEEVEEGKSKRVKE